MQSGYWRLLPRLLLPVFVVLPLFTLWPALSGPFLFDDYSNLDALKVIEGEITPSNVKEYLTEKAAGPTGRPLSMLSFLLNDSYWPSEPQSFKYTNLLIHVLNGLLLSWLVIVIVRQWAGELTNRHAVLAILVAAFWVLNPYQLSSVMYVVQRMAQLSTLCVLAGLILYITGRSFLASGKYIKGFSTIWFGYLVGAGLGVLFKENAALFVLLVPIFEVLLFRERKLKPALSILLIITVAVPALSMLVLLGSYFLNTHSYEWFRDFSLAERLLTQGRALGYYLWRYLIPGVGYTGLYADGFEKSVGILQPASTLVWLLIHGVIISVALACYRRLPLFSLGVLFFYVAHSMEASAIPLELFFEHRNYLPSCLLLLGVFHIKHKSLVTTILGIVVSIAAALQYLQSTYWGDEQHLTTIMVVENPSSERARIAYANYLERNGNLAESLLVMKQYTKDQDYGINIGLNVAKMACYLGIDQLDDVEILLSSTQKYRGKAEPMVRQFESLASWVHDGKCQTLTFEHLDQFLENYIKAFPRDGEATQAYYVARSYLAYYRENYPNFRQYMTSALEAHPNLSLTYSACSQFTVIGGVSQGCDCFQKYEHLLTLSQDGKGTLTQKLLGEPVDDTVLGFKEEREAVCNAAKLSPIVTE